MCTLLDSLLTFSSSSSDSFTGCIKSKSVGTCITLLAVGFDEYWYFITKISLPTLFSLVHEVVVSLLMQLIIQEEAINLIYTDKSWTTFNITSIDTRVGLGLDTAWTLILSFSTCFLFFKLCHVISSRSIPLSQTICLFYKASLIGLGHSFWWRHTMLDG